MSESYDFSDPNELIAFDIDCAKACFNSPKSKLIEHKICLGRETSVAKIFIEWYSNEILWLDGYSSVLSTRAQKTFARYEVLKRTDVFDHETRRVYCGKDAVTLYAGYFYR